MATKWSIKLRRQLVFGYLAEPETQRLPLKKFLKNHKIQKRTFYLLEGEYNSQVKNRTMKEKEEHKAVLKATVDDAWDRIEGREPPKRIKGVEIAKISDEEKLALARKVYIDAMSREASAKDKDLAVRMLGMLIEKQEITHTVLSAEDVSRIDREAERRIEELNTRTRGVSNREEGLPKELSLFPDKIREDTNSDGNSSL